MSVVIENHIMEYADSLNSRVYLGMQELSMEMERTAVNAETRHQTYNLRNSIASGTERTPGAVTSRVFASTDYAIYQEEGNSKYNVPYAGLHFLKGALDRAREVAIPYLEKALRH